MAGSWPACRDSSKLRKGVIVFWWFLQRSPAQICKKGMLECAASFEKLSVLVFLLILIRNHSKIIRPPQWYLSQWKNCKPRVLRKMLTCGPFSSTPRAVASEIVSKQTVLLASIANTHLLPSPHQVLLAAALPFPGLLLLPQVPTGPWCDVPEPPLMDCRRFIR